MHAYDKHITRFYQYELFAFAFLLPIYRKVIPYIIVAILVTWLFDGDFTIKAKRLVRDRSRIYALLFSSLYLIYLIGLTYTQNFTYGFFDMEVKMSLLIFPLVFATIREEVISAEFVRKVLVAFVFGVVASILLCYGVAGYNYFLTGKSEHFYYRNLAVLIHPSYLAMYVIFAIAILLYFNLKGLMASRASKYLSWLAIILFEMFVVMLSSKAGIFSLVITIALFFSYVLFIERRILRAILLSSILTATFLVFFISFPVLSERFQQTREVLEDAELNSAEVASSTGERILIWWYSFEITNDNFLFGVGTGDVKDQLLEKYEEKGMAHAIDLSLNAHNQYLQTMVALGIVGLIVLLLCLLLPFLIGIDNRQYLYMMFLILVAFNFLFESMLETQAGVVFYAFFNAYLFSIKKDPASLEAES